MAVQIDPLLRQIRERLRAAANEGDRTAIRRFFRETVTPYGVKSTLVHELTRYALPLLRERTPAARNRFFQELWKSGMYEEGMLAVYLARRFTRGCGPCEFKLWERWLDRYVTNWAHCDGISMHLIGAAIAHHPELAARLEPWTLSPNLWKRRSAAASLVREARQGRHRALTGRILRRLEGDPESLIQKAVIWLQRERARAPSLRAR
ncbi:MAG: DNA alkylation repair protein [Bryobacterales bacterium]|nr:DNA alkylation repair protein [Bryobacterales bacterium]